jgi:hypothetical protein
MPSTLTRRLDRLTARVAAGSPSPTVAKYAVASWADYHSVEPLFGRDGGFLDRFREEAGAYPPPPPGPALTPEEAALSFGEAVERGVVALAPGFRREWEAWEARQRAMPSLYEQLRLAG